MTTQFSPEDIAGVSGYMNESAMRANLTEIVRWSSKDESIRDAQMVHFDGLGFDAEVTRESGVDTVRVPWPREVTSRGEVREALFTLFERAAFG